MTSPDSEQLKKFQEIFGIDEEGNPPPLTPGLERYIQERDSGLVTFEHPLYHTLYTPMQNGHINKAIEVKAAEVELAVKRRDWFVVLFVYYERPYRIETFKRYQHMMTDKEYWHLLGEIWTDSENIFQHIEDWRELLSSKRKRRFEMMDKDELAYFREELPDEIEIFRGTNAPDGMGCGMAWSLREVKARWFANRLGASGRVLKGTVAKHNVIAFFDGRSEAEIVVFPEFVYDLETVEIK